MPSSLQRPWDFSALSPQSFVHPGHSNPSIDIDIFKIKSLTASSSSPS
jgi:hypothetical protein